MKDEFNELLGKVVLPSSELAENEKPIEKELEDDVRISECRKIIKYLVVDNETKLEDWLNELRKYIQEYRRLSYTAIADYVYNKCEKSDIKKIQVNLKAVIGYLKSKIPFSDEKDDKLYEIVLKLEDNIGLSQKQVEYVEKVKEKEEKVKNLENDIKEASNRIQDTEKNYIAILGIFSAVVLAFTANLAFSSSVLENIHKSSFYMVGFAVTMIAFFIINVIISLFHFIEVLTRIDEKRFITRWSFAVPNIVIVVIFFLLGVAWYFDIVGKRNIKIGVNKQIEVTQTMDNKTAAPQVIK